MSLVILNVMTILGQQSTVHRILQQPIPFGEMLINRRMKKLNKISTNHSISHIRMFYFIGWTMDQYHYNVNWKPWQQPNVNWSIHNTSACVLRQEAINLPITQSRPRSSIDENAHMVVNSWRTGPLSKTLRMSAMILNVILVLLPLVSCFEFKHHDNKELMEVLKNVTKRCPNISRTYDLAMKSVNGQPLTVIQMTNNPRQKTTREYTNWALNNQEGYWTPNIWLLSPPPKPLWLNTIYYWRKWFIIILTYTSFTYF